MKHLDMIYEAPFYAVIIRPTKHPTLIQACVWNPPELLTFECQVVELALSHWCGLVMFSFMCNSSGPAKMRCFDQEQTPEV